MVVKYKKMGRRSSLAVGRQRHRFPLRFRFVNDKTNLLYLRWVLFFVNWCCLDGRHPNNPSSLDQNLTAGVEHMYHDDLSYSYAGALLSDVQHFCAIAPHQIKLAWRTFGAWKKEKAGKGVPPLPDFVLRAMVVFFDSCGQTRLAALLLMAFNCYLRTGEFLRLKKQDITLNSTNTNGAILLDATKTSSRNGGAESVLFDDPFLINYLKVVLQKMKDDEQFFDGTSTQFRNVFHGVLRVFGLQSHGFQPYSLRRGGATADFMRHNSIDRCLFRGRWRSVRTARIYIQLGRACSVENEIRGEIRSRCSSVGDLLPLIISPP